MPGFDEDPLLFHDLKSYNSIQDIIDDDLRQLHQFFVEPMLKYVDEGHIEPLCDQGTEIPLLPHYFANDSGNLIDPVAANEAAKRSIELFLTDWAAKMFIRHEDEAISVTDWRITSELTNKQEFVRVRFLKYCSGQQTRAFIFFDDLPLDYTDPTF